MSWLRRLLGGEAVRDAELEPRTRVKLPTHCRGVVRLAEVDMVGERTASPNGRFNLIWHDRRWFDGVPEPGRYVLLDGAAVALDERMERPQHGKVADDGTFILNDWGAADQLVGTFLAFRSDGSRILTRRYAANLLNNGLSRDGRLAACQTCNAPGSPDSSVLSVFDLAAGVERATWTAESGWAGAYEFPEGGDRIRMVRSNHPPLDYSLDGEFLDRRLWLADEVGRGTLYVIRKALAEGEASTGLSSEALREGVRAALAEGDERLEAEAWRLLGEVEEAAGALSAALDAYDRALAVNPKVGVAKRAAALRKTVQR